MKTNKYFKTFFINKKSQTSNPTSKKASIKQPIQRINQNKKKKPTLPITAQHSISQNPVNNHHHIKKEKNIRICGEGGLPRRIWGGVLEGESKIAKPCPLLFCFRIAI